MIFSPDSTLATADDAAASADSTGFGERAATVRKSRP